jgi:C-terminal processing protease CtpA/Prc
MMRHASLRVCLFAAFLGIGIQSIQSKDTGAQLQEARRLLTGERKDAEHAKRVLLEIVQSGNRATTPETAVWADIYLGYIEDRAQNRQIAIHWYETALSVQGASSSSLSVARSGLQQPLIWIRHLDESAAPPKNTQTTATASSRGFAYGGAYVTLQPPAGSTLARNLSEQQRRENFEALWGLIDFNYAHFKLKSIDWAEVGARYRARLSTETSDDDFYHTMFQLVNELKDTHSWLDNYKTPVLAGVADMPTDLFEGKPFVINGPKAGWEVVSIDGIAPAEKMESLKPYLRGYSSERAFRREAARSLLAGKESDPVSVQLRSPEGQVETLSLRRGGRRTPAPLPSFPSYLTRQHFVHFGRLPSGLGYIQIGSFNGREEIGKEFDRALEVLRTTPGLILDIRNNSGGFGHSEIVGRFLMKRTLVGFSYIKSGPGHTDLLKREEYLDPSGEWQYSGPVALLVNDITGSASDLFANELRSAGRVVTIGTTTHGNLSGVAMYGVLPCGLVVRISNGYITDTQDRPIEVTGNIPDIAVEPAIQDYLNGRDPVLDRATDAILRKLSQ